MKDWEYTNGLRSNSRPVVIGSQPFTRVSHYGYVLSSSPSSSFGSVGTTPRARRVVYPSGGGTNYDEEGFIVFRDPVTAAYLAMIGTNPADLAHNAFTTELDAYSNGSGVGSFNWRAFFRIYGVTSWGGHGTSPSDPNPITWTNKGDVILTDATFCGSVRAAANAYDPSAALVQDSPTHSINALAVQGTQKTILGLWIKLDSITPPSFSPATSGDYYSARFSFNPTGTPGFISV